MEVKRALYKFGLKVQRPLVVPILSGDASFRLSSAFSAGAPSEEICNFRLTLELGEV